MRVIGGRTPRFNPRDKEIPMQNVGGIDRILRIVVGLVLIGLTLAGTLPVWGWIGVVPLATGLFRFCPAYSLFGIRTCPAQGQKPTA
jgi:hypothetical protein